MFSGIPSVYESHLLECRGLSFVNTVHRGPWCSRLYTPPIVAEFLREVSLELNAGEIAGICGVSGSGKSTLLNVIAAKACGSIGGTVLLNKQLLTASRFRKMCSFVDVRLLSLLNEWELLGYGHECVGDLSESSRRRLLLAIATAKDPVLIIADDPIRHLEPLSAYQLMLCLQSFVKRHRRMAVISLRVPRSDIAQLLDRLTLLYYGESVYSGQTSKLPLYLHQLGFICPIAENPASYLISLVTVDRENATRFTETQEQAIKLVEAFRNYFPIIGNTRSNLTEPIGLSTSAALCNGSRPGLISQLKILMG
ncbi:unnamed protein product, partial [Mesorhabditis belari]|uniref:ABC transporter domain-containing protein n=1 Tax=Mesorhabditis belari TaxID=2138241 RepID=A0AAF3JC72_9BILA